MSGPNVNATITADPKQAQQAIAETIRTVEKMEKTVNSSSLTGVRAFRAEAESARELLRALGATQAQQDKLNASVSRFNTQVNAAGAQFGSATRGFVAGAAQMVHSGNLMGEGLKGVITQGANMAIMFGVGGPIVAAVGITGLAIADMFAQTREELEKTRLDALESLKQLGLTNPAGADRRAAAKEALAGNIRGQLNEVQASASGGNARYAITGDERKQKQEYLAQLEAEAKLLREQAKIGRELSSERKKEADAEELKRKTKSQAEADAKRANEEIVVDRVTPTANGRGGGFILPGVTPIAESGGPAASDRSGAFDTLKDSVVGGLREITDAAKTSTASFTDLNGAIGEGLRNAAETGLDALVKHSGGAIKKLKAAAAEPIVANLQMIAKKELVLAATEIFNPVLALKHAANAGLAMAGAQYVGRLGGISGGGSGGGGGGGGGFAGGSTASTLADKGRGSRTLTIHGKGFMNLNDPEVRDGLARAIHELGDLGDVQLVVD